MPSARLHASAREGNRGQEDPGTPLATPVGSRRKQKEALWPTHGKKPRRQRNAAWPPPRMTRPASWRTRPNDLATSPRRVKSSHVRLTSESRSIPAVRATPGSRKARDSLKAARGPLSPWLPSRPTSSANSGDSRRRALYSGKTKRTISVVGDPRPANSTHERIRIAHGRPDNADECRRGRRRAGNSRSHLGVPYQAGLPG